MKPFKFDVSLTVDRHTGKLLAALFQIREGHSAKTKEFNDGDVLADYDTKGNLLAVEVLAPCEVTVLDRIAPTEPKVKRFIRDKMPREMALVPA